MTALGPISSFRPWGLRPTRNAMALPGQKTSDWVTGMTGALHFMGAAPELIVPDNPRAVIAVPDRYEPRVGDTVLDFARHYGRSEEHTSELHSLMRISYAGFSLKKREKQSLITANVRAHHTNMDRPHSTQQTLR